MIDRDLTGEPTGFLHETAWSAAHAASLPSHADTDEYAKLIEDRARLLLTYGVTAVHDTAVSPSAETAYRILASQRRLPVSVLAMPHAAELLTGPDPRRWDGLVTGEGDENFRIGPVKVFADGAFLLACDGHMGGQRVASGILMPGIADHIATAVDRGFGVAVHAMGNVGLRTTLDAWRAATRRVDPQHGLRIEHATLAGQAEIADMARLGVAGVVQPGFVRRMADAVGGFEWDDLTWLPFADLLDEGVVLAASSDAPCSPIAEPLALSKFGVDRTGGSGRALEPEQSVPMREWLRLWTAGAADAGVQSDERGRIRPGLRADFAVLDGDVDGDRPLRVTQTWVAGERVY